MEVSREKIGVALAAWRSGQIHKGRVRIPPGYYIGFMEIIPMLLCIIDLHNILKIA
jgi:hypothetical protein